MGKAGQMTTPAQTMLRAPGEVLPSSMNRLASSALANGRPVTAELPVARETQQPGGTNYGIAQKDQQKNESFLRLSNQRLKTQVDSLQRSKVSNAEYEVLLQKYGRALEQIEVLQEREISAEEIAERDLRIQDLQLQNLELKRRLRLACGKTLLDLDLLSSDASKNPYALFDDFESEIESLKKEIKKGQDRNAKLQLEVDNFSKTSFAQQYTNKQQIIATPKELTTERVRPDAGQHRRPRAREIQTQALIRPDAVTGRPRLAAKRRVSRQLA